MKHNRDWGVFGGRNTQKETDETPSHQVRDKPCDAPFNTEKANETLSPPKMTLFKSPTLARTGLLENQGTKREKMLSPGREMNEESFLHQRHMVFILGRAMPQDSVELSGEP